MTKKRLDPLTGELVEPSREALADMLAKKFANELPSALDQSNRIAVWMSETGMLPSESNTIALLLLACGNAQRVRRPPLNHNMMELLLAFTWDLLEQGHVDTVRAPPKGPSS
jgi:hypothetical protein